MTKSSIDDALTGFLREQQTRVAPRTFARYEEVIDLFKHSMNGYGYQGLDEAEHARWQEVFDAGDEDAFTRVFGPEKIPENLGEFLGYFMVHKVMAGGDLLRASGTVTKKLARWLAAQGLIDQEVADDAAERGGEAARDLPRAERLASLLYALARTAPDVDPGTVADVDWVDDQVCIERVEPGALWFSGGIGPLKVPRATSDLAQPGWMVSIVMARIRNRWHLLQVGNVYP